MKPKRKLGTRFSPSIADRYLNCRASVVMTQDYEREEGAVYANAGNVAHKLGEICIATGDKLEKYIGAKLCESEGIDIPVDESMVEGVQQYVDWVKEQNFDTVKVELSAPLDFIPGSEASRGIIDLVGIVKDFNLLYIGDYKNGFIPVDASTRQIGTYGIAARELVVEMGLLEVVDEVRGVIIQPNGGDGELIKEYSWTNEALDELKADIIEAVNWVINTKPEDLSDEDFHDGDHCKFCPFSPHCPTKGKKLFDVLPVDKAVKLNVDVKPTAPSLLSDDMIARIVESRKDIKAWLDDVYDYATRELINGREIQGVKVVTAKRGGHSTWSKLYTESDIASKLVTSGIARDNVWGQPKIISPAVARKLMGKDKDRIEDLIFTPEKGVELVTESDPRQVRAMEEMFPATTNNELFL